MKQQIQTFTITRDGALDSRYYSKLKRKDTNRRLKTALRASLKAIGRASFWLYCKMYDDCRGTNYRALYFPAAPELPQGRNTLGQYA